MSHTIWNDHFVSTLRTSYCILAVIPVVVICYNRMLIIDRAKQFKAPKVGQQNAISSSIGFLVVLVILYAITYWMKTTTEEDNEQTDRQQVSRYQIHVHNK